MEERTKNGETESETEASSMGSCLDGLLLVGVTRKGSLDSVKDDVHLLDLIVAATSTESEDTDDVEHPDKGTDAETYWDNERSVLDQTYLM